jgi:hypothetical protein
MQTKRIALGDFLSASFGLRVFPDGSKIWPIPTKKGFLPSTTLLLCCLLAFFFCKYNWSHASVSSQASVNAAVAQV